MSFHLQFPNAVVLNADGRRNTQMSAKEREGPQKIRDGETTIKIKICSCEGGGIGGREENRPKRCFFVGSVTTMKF